MNALQQVTSGQYGSNLSVTFGYDSYGFPTSTAARTIQNYSYNFNPANGDLNWMQNNKYTGLKEYFYYDNIDRLDYIMKGTTTTLDMAYHWDKGGIFTKSDVGSYLYNNTLKPYALSEISPTSAIIPNTVDSLTYTSFESVNTIQEDPYSASFVYNADNQRAKMEVKQNTTTILTRWYPSGSYIKETASGTTKEYTFVGGDAYTAPVVAITQSGTTTYYYLLRDHLGSITHVVDASTGTLSYQYSYDAWGRMRTPTGWVNYNPGSEPALFIAGRGFTGHEHLPWFNLINMNGRVYDPLTGQFLSPDNNIQDPYNSQNLNRYSYCLNNPLKYFDPTGFNVVYDFVAGMIANGYNHWNSSTGYTTLNETDLTLYALCSIAFGGGGTGVPSGSGFQGPGLPYMLGEVTVAAQAPQKNTSTTPVNNNDYHGSSYWLAKAGAIAVTTSVADGPIPIGEAFGAAVITTAAIHDAVVATNNFLNKQGVQYTLRTYTGDIYKIGQTTRYNFTTNSQWRYSQPQLDSWGVIFVAEFPGNRVEILLVEKMKIWNYIHTYNTLPPGNKVPW